MTFRIELRPACALVFSLAAAALTGCGAGTSLGGPVPVSAGGPSSTPAPGSSSTPAPGTSATPVPGTSSTPAPGPSNTPAPGASNTPTPGPTATATPRASSTPTSPASSTPAPAPTATPAGSGNAAAGIPFPAATDPDRFYAQPSPFPNLPHGTILASRSIAYAPGGVSMSNTAYQVTFVSQDVDGRKIAALMTVVKPLTTTLSPEPMYVQAFAEDALGAQCAPSHYATGSSADTTAVAETGIATGALSAGYILVIPDIEGPFSEYAVARQSGYTTLDAMTAAEHFAPLGLNAKTPVGENGYSGGAEAVSWAAAEQPTYAPGINLVGTSSGGTPADILGILEGIDGTSALNMLGNQTNFNVIFMSGVGINRGYPNFLTPILNAKGVAAAKAMENGCLGSNSDGSAGPTGHVSDYVTVANVDTDPHITTVAAEASEPQPGLVPGANMFIYHAVTDELIPVAGVDNLVKGWCAEGTPIEYYRDPAGGSHLGMEAQNQATVLTYMSERFAGTPLTVPSTMTCN